MVDTKEELIIKPQVMATVTDILMLPIEIFCSLHPVTLLNVRSIREEKAMYYLWH